MVGSALCRVSPHLARLIRPGRGRDDGDALAPADLLDGDLLCLQGPLEHDGGRQARGVRTFLLRGVSRELLVGVGELRFGAESDAARGGGHGRCP